MTLQIKEEKVAGPATAPVAPETGLGLRRPRLRLYFYSVIASDTVLFYCEGEENIWLRGTLVSRILPQLLPRLNGLYTPEEIIAQLGHDQRKDILTVLKLLKDKRIIEEGEPTLPMDFPPGYLEHHASQLTFLSHFHQDQYRAQAHLRQASVTLLDNQTSYGPLLATSLAQTGLKSLKLVSCADLARQDLVELPGYEELAAELRGQAPFTELSTERWGYEWMAPATEVAPPLGTEASYHSLAPLVEGAGLVVVLTEGYSTHICDVINELALKKNFRWLNLSLKGSQVLIGPAILPHGTACWRCYQSRVWANAAREESYEMLEHFDAQYHANRHTSNYGQLAAIGQVATGLGANEVIKALTLYAGTVYGRVHSFNAVTFQSQQSEVLRLPRCKACGRDRMRVPNKLWYSSRPLTERREPHA